MNEDTNTAKKIEPRVLKGFRDTLPAEALQRQRILRSFEELCANFGFVPIDTPVLEYSEILFGKGEIDKQIFRFQDKGGRDVAMRFDLTIPLARFVSANLEVLPLPFKRYHCAKVFRGENTQRGRYREFVQCDFDILGVDSIQADFEILQLIHENFAALHIRDMHIHFNHRGLFNSFLGTLGCTNIIEILRLVDKKAKIGLSALQSQLHELCGAQATDILEYISPESSNITTLQKMVYMSGGRSPESERLHRVLELAEYRFIEDRLILDPSISRGLDYYTGIIFETFIDSYKEIGSLCSGGRYNNLVDVYSKRTVPGIGASIGLDRLIDALATVNAQSTTKQDATSFADILIFMLDEAYIAEYLRLAYACRQAGLRTEVYPHVRKLAVQFSYAEKKNIPLVFIAGEVEIRNNTVNYKNLQTKEVHEGIGISQALKLAMQEFDIEP